MNGTIRWFARHGVASNLLMVLIIVGGVASISTIRQEVFPEFSLGLITISVPYLGAAPEEVEEGVCLKIEEAIQGLDGVKKVTSTAAEGMGAVTVEVLDDYDTREVLDDIKTRIDAIDSFPELTEKPVIREVTNRRQVIDIGVWGDVDELTLRRVAEQVRDDVAALPGITVTELANARPYEISIEVSENQLRRHGLTFDEVARAVRRSSLDLPGGSVKTQGGEILLRTKGQAYRGREFEDLVLLTRFDGTHIRLGEVARIVDDFADTDQYSRFDSEPAMLVSVFRVGEQDALGVAAGVQEYIVEAQRRLPEGVTLTTWNDASRILRDRRNLLLRNGMSGLALVFITLALFLRFRLAWWVTLGLFIAFMGAFWVMPALDVSISVISLFAFILVLGIVVDDAIVVGESIHTHQHRSGKGLEGAIEGTISVAQPVVFAVLTTVAAFTPLLNVTGATGRIMRVIPLIVIPCLLWSLVESLWILPAHLSHYTHDKKQPKSRWSVKGLWWRVQSRFADGLESFILRLYRPSLQFALRWRYLTLAASLATLLLTAGFWAGGHIKFIFFPDVESDFISAAVTLPPGTPVERTSEAVALLEESALRVEKKIAERFGESVVGHMVSAIGEQPFRRVQATNAGGAADREIFAHLGELTIELTPAEVRSVGSAEITQLWREETGPIPDAIEVAFTSSLFSTGEDINVQLTGSDLDQLRMAAEDLKGTIGEYAGVYDITDSFRPGKRELKLQIKPAAELVGLSLADLGRQVRQAFYGEEAQRIQRGRDEVKVMVRYPESERRSLGNLEKMRVRTPDGAEVPFSEVASVETGRGYSTIRRVDRRRAINVTAAVDPAQANASEIIADLMEGALPALVGANPGVQYSFEGTQAEQRDTLGGLFRGFGLAVIMIYALLAIPLRSYVQPLLIMSAIPFGLVGAIWGHLIVGLSLTILSLFGLVALTGVVINDSLVMVDFINRHRQTKDTLLAAVRTAGEVRFRPILLTSLTTFAGLSPLMLERSMQARFLIPMAVSLAFGVIFATFITLVLIPAGYMVMEDVRAGWLRWFGKDESADRPDAQTAPNSLPSASSSVQTR